MTPQTEFLQMIADIAYKNCMLDNQISLEELSQGNSLYAELGSGFVKDTFYGKSTTRIYPVLFLCRHADQRRCLEQLACICNYFQRLNEYPQGKSFSWLDTEIAKEPSRIGRDEDGSYHYSCILNCKLFF